LEAGQCYWYENHAWWAKRLLRTTAKCCLPDEIVMRKRQVFLAPLAHWLLSPSIRAIVVEEIADSPFWKLDVLRRQFRDSILRKLRSYRALNPEDGWQEQVWVLLVLCAWINRRQVTTRPKSKAATDG
jgi:asparagine synthetase B (glutamine-hydrolysing)